jgi:hypothetical protein
MGSIARCARTPVRHIRKGGHLGALIGVGLEAEELEERIQTA